jgi:hypothetical protein
MKKNVTNDYSKGNPEAYPANIHTALTLMNEYKPLKLDAVAIPTQGTAFVTKSYGKGKKGAPKKYYNDAEWKALSSEAQIKIINEQKKAMGDDGNNNKSVASAKSVKSIKPITKTMKLLEKDNCRLKKSVSALQKCNEGENNAGPYHLPRGPVITKRQWRCCKNLTQRLHWLLSQASPFGWTSEMFSCWTINQL